MNKRSFIFIAVSLFLCLLTAGGTFSQSPEYRLQATDVLQITVHEQDDLTTKTRVTQDGYITFPLIGKIKAEGMTVQELELKLKESLEKDYLVNAQVLVFIEEYHARQFSVIGEVNSPGKYDMPAEKRITILEAIAMAGGFSKDADTNKTRVIRVKDGIKKTLIIRVKDITDKGNKEEDIAIEPDDIVFVPESFF